MVSITAHKHIITQSFFHILQHCIKHLTSELTIADRVEDIFYMRGSTDNLCGYHEGEIGARLTLGATPL